MKLSTICLYILTIEQIHAHGFADSGLSRHIRGFRRTASPVGDVKSVSTGKTTSSIKALTSSTKTHISSLNISSSKLTSLIFSSSTTTKSTSTKAPRTSTTSSARTISISTISIPLPTYTLVHGAVLQQSATQWINDTTRQVSQTQQSLTTSEVSDQTYSSDVWDDPTLGQLFPGTGTIPLDSGTKQYLRNRTITPGATLHYSRDGGHGGTIGDHNIWWFADTMTFYNINETHNGSWIGFVADTAAIDLGNNARRGEPIVLQDTVGSFRNEKGAARWWIPMTIGESMYNVQVPSERYAHWILSSMVPFNNNSGLLYCPIVFINTKSNISTFQYAGNTLVNVTVEAGQPMADRIVTRLFKPDVLEYGNTFGGYRSWGLSGVGGSDGKVYLLAPGGGGLFLARVKAREVADLQAYEYWHNSSNSGPGWTSRPHTKNSSISDMMIHIGPNTFSSGDLIFSTHHGTFILIYQDSWADNKLWYTYLQVSERLNPHYRNKYRHSDIAKNLVKYPWAEPRLLMNLNHYKTFTYDAGAHVGYFGAEDLSNGGTRMLVSWTAPTDYGSGQYLNTTGYGGYQIWSAEIDWA